MSFDVDSIRRDFPIFETKMRGKPLTYLDSAASAQKPRVVLDAMYEFYGAQYANIHRGVYQLSADATRQYEAVRGKVARFIGAPDEREVIFVRNATEAINLVARTWGDEQVGRGDEIVITTMEHHANIVPWQMLAERRGAVLRVAEKARQKDLKPEGQPHSGQPQQQRARGITGYRQPGGRIQFQTVHGLP
jgi:cysteine desulfurase/selenocysteine lyase